MTLPPYTYDHHGFDYLINLQIHSDGNGTIRRGELRTMLDATQPTARSANLSTDEHIFIAPWVWRHQKDNSSHLPLLWIPVDRSADSKSPLISHHLPMKPGASFALLDYQFPSGQAHLNALKGKPLYESMDEIVRILLEHCELKPDAPPAGYLLGSAALFTGKPITPRQQRPGTSRQPIPVEVPYHVLSARVFSGFNDQQSDLINSIRNLSTGEHQVADGPAASGKTYSITAFLENEASINGCREVLPASISLIAGDFQPVRPAVSTATQIKDSIFNRWIEIPDENYLTFEADELSKNGMPSSAAYANMLSAFRSDDFIRGQRVKWLERFNSRFPSAKSLSEAVTYLQSLTRYMSSRTKTAYEAVIDCTERRESSGSATDFRSRRHDHMRDLKAVSDELANLQITLSPERDQTHSYPRPGTLGKVTSIWRKRASSETGPTEDMPDTLQDNNRRRLTLRDRKRHYTNQIKKIDRWLRAENDAIALVSSLLGRRPASDINQLDWALTSLQKEITSLNYQLAMRLREARFLVAINESERDLLQPSTNPFETSPEWLSLLSLLFDGLVVNHIDLNTALSALSSHGLSEGMHGKFEHLIIEPDVTITSMTVNVAPLLAKNTVYLVDRSISDENHHNLHLTRLEKSTRFCQNLPLAPPGVTLPVSYGWSRQAAVRANNVALSRLMMPTAQHKDDSFLFHAPIYGQATCDHGSIRNTTEATAIFHWLNDHEGQIVEFHGGSSLDESVVIATPFHGQRDTIKKLIRARFPKLKVVSQDTISFSDAKLAIFSPCVSALDHSAAGSTMRSALKSFFGNAKFSSAIFGDPRMFSTLKADGFTLDTPDALPFHTPIYPGVVISRELQTLREHEDALQEVLLRAKRRVMIGSLNWHLPFSAWKRKDVSQWINQAAARGVAVTLVIGLKGAMEEDVRKSISTLIHHKIEVIIHDKGHSKVVLADDNAKITGSFNWFGGGDFVDASIYTRTGATDSQIQELWDSTISRYTKASPNRNAQSQTAYPLPASSGVKRPPLRPPPKRPR